MRQQTLERDTPLSHNCHLSVSAANQAKYGPEKDRAHTDVTSLSDVYQWMQVCCYWPMIGVLVLVGFKRSSCVSPFEDRAKHIKREGTVVVVPAAFYTREGVAHCRSTPPHGEDSETASIIREVLVWNSLRQTYWGRLLRSIIGICAVYHLPRAKRHQPADAIM